MGFLDVVKARYNLLKVEIAYALNPSEENERALMDAKTIVFMVIGVYLISALLPSAISAINGANTTGWTTEQIAIWGIVGILIIAIVIVKLVE